MTILAAVDGTERSEHVISIAYDLATTYGDSLVALHVVPQLDFEAHQAEIKDVPGFSEHTIAQETGSAETFVRKLANEVIEDLDPAVLEPRGRVGNVPESVLAEADELDPRFLVIGGRRQSPAGKAVFGNTAQKILLNADCPVVSKLTDA